MLKKYIIILSFFILCSLPVFSQTQEQINHLLQGGSQSESNENIELDKKEQNKAAKAEKTASKEKEKAEKLEQKAKAEQEKLEQKAKAEKEKLEQKAKADQENLEQKALEEKEQIDQKAKEAQNKSEKQAKAAQEKLENEKENSEQGLDSNTEKVKQEQELKTDKAKSKVPQKEAEPKLEKVKAEKSDSKDIKEKLVTTEENTKSVANSVEAVSNEYQGGAKALMKQGDKRYASNKYYGAIAYYNAALDKTNKKKLSAKLNYKLGQSAFAVRDYQMTENSLKESLSIPGKKKQLKDAKYLLGLALKHQGKYDQSKKVFQEFITEYEKDASLSYERTKARLEMKGCDYAMNLMVENPAFTIRNPGENVNGPYADFGPEIRNKELVFSKIIAESPSQENGKDHVAQLYSAEMYNDVFNFAQNFSPVLNDGAYYVCNPNFTADGKAVYFTKCELNKQQANLCAIYYSELIDGVWAEPRALNASINEAGSNNSHPQIVVLEDGQELIYFTSDRASGRGGKDIYYAYKTENGDFGKARNIGSPINKKYDELSPFYHQASNTLYFSTDGKASLGGLDVFKSEYINDEWTEPMNLDTPINSSLDDYDFILDNEGSYGFLVSNRVGTTSVRSATCCDDIFEVRSTQIELFVKTLVYAENKDGRALLSGAQISLENLSTQEIIEKDLSNNAFFAALATESDFELRASHKDFEDVKLNFSTKDLLKSDTLQFDVFFTDRKDFNNEVIGVIYYEYNQARLTKEAPKTLEGIVEFLTEYPKAMVEIHAHTDGNGTPAYNLNLSKERCEAAYNYLTFNGIQEERIVKKWFGETKPVAPETNEDGADNPEGRALNRRTEFKIKNPE